jgi:hypothetical protein
VLSKGPLGVHTTVRYALRANLIDKESFALQQDFICGGCWRQEEKDECQVAEAGHCISLDV